MSNLENLVPPLGLCKLIPAGEFVDSALVWDIHGKFDNWHVEKRVKRSVKFGDYGVTSPPHADIPAPTLEEVLEAIREIKTWDTLTMTRKTDDKTKLATAALRQWFYLKGIEVK